MSTKNSKYTVDNQTRDLPVCRLFVKKFQNIINPLNAKLNPICRLLALLGAHHILHVSGEMVKKTTTLKTKAFRYDTLCRLVNTDRRLEELERLHMRDRTATGVTDKLDYFTVKMAALRSFETTVTIHQSTRCNSREDLNLHQH